jgi:predicted O-methyltransferase YrrM
MASADTTIRVPYSEYVTAVSHPAHAISIQLAFYLWEMAEEIRPLRVADLGSGFSSYVVRTWAAECSPETVVYSVDDDAAWLEKTRAFLTSHDVQTDNLVLWDDFTADSFDMVLHDLGDMVTRVKTLPRAAEIVRPGGTLILDDVHMPTYERLLTEFLDDAGIPHESARAQTGDMIGRYSWVAYPGAPAPLASSSA